MTEREKVIKGLEVCIDREPGKYDCYKCPYETDGNDCDINLSKDALALLKEQEPVDPAIGGNQNSCWYFICPRCQLAIDKGDKYCRHCGRKVKWDG